MQVIFSRFFYSLVLSSPIFSYYSGYFDSTIATIVFIGENKISATFLVRCLFVRKLIKRVFNLIVII